MKYKIILKTTHRNIHRVDNCMNTWLSTLDYICLTDRPTKLFNEWSGSYRDDYSSNEEKTVNFINHIITTNEYDEYDWLVFIDDDAILNVQLFNKVIHSLDKNKIYGLLMRSFKKEPNLEYPSGGCGYFISPSLIKGKKLMTNKGWGFEDASIGRWAEENNISLSEMPDGIKLNGWFPFKQYWERLITEGEEYAKTITFSKEDDEFIKSHLTHHYIRWKPIMEYIHNVNKKAPIN